MSPAEGPPDKTGAETHCGCPLQSVLLLPLLLLNSSPAWRHAWLSSRHGSPAGARACAVGASGRTCHRRCSTAGQRWQPARRMWRLCHSWHTSATLKQHSPHTTAQGVGTAWRESVPQECTSPGRRSPARCTACACQQVVSPERLTRCRLLVGSPARRPLGSAHTLWGASGWPEAASSAAARASTSPAGTGIPCLCTRVTSGPSLSCSTTRSAHQLACETIKFQQCTAELLDAGAT